MPHLPGVTTANAAHHDPNNWPSRSAHLTHVVSQVLSRCISKAMPDEPNPVPVLVVQRPVAWCVHDCGPAQQLGRERDLWTDTRPLADADKGALAGTGSRSGRLVQMSVLLGP